MSLRRAILKEQGQDTDQTTTSSALWGCFYDEEKQVNGVGAERSAGSREESDGCDLACLFLLEHVDKNDRAQAPV